MNRTIKPVLTRLPRVLACAAAVLLGLSAPSVSAQSSSPQDVPVPSETKPAQLQGVELTDEHWHVLETARKDFEATGTSPNLRRLTEVASVTTKDLYRLFPKAPGRTLAKIAGLPKPAGCL